MKRWIALCIGMMLMFSLAACSNNHDSGADNRQNATSSSKEESSEDAIKNSQSQTAEEGTKPSDVAEYGQQFEDDQFMEIVEKMKEAETIVIGSPVYWHSMSGAVRNLIDRFYGPVSQGALSGRKFVFLFQGAAPEKWMMEKAEYTMSRFARMYGMEYVGMAVNNKEAEKIAKKL